MRGEHDRVRAPVRREHLGAGARGGEARQREPAAELQHPRAGARRLRVQRAGERGPARPQPRPPRGSGRPAAASSSRSASQSTGWTTCRPAGSRVRTWTSSSGAGSDDDSTPRSAARRSASEARRAASAAVIPCTVVRPWRQAASHPLGDGGTGRHRAASGVHGTDALPRARWPSPSPAAGAQAAEHQAGGPRRAEHRPRPRRRPRLDPAALHAGGPAPAARGVTLERFYVADSLCCTSRASMLAGRYPHNTRVRTNVSPTGRLHSRGRATTAPARSFAVGLVRRGLPHRDVRQVPQRLPGRRAARPGWTRLAGRLRRVPRLRLRLLRQRHAGALRQRADGLRDRRHRPRRRPVHPRLGRGGRAVHGAARHVHAAHADGAGAQARAAPATRPAAGRRRVRPARSATRRAGSARAPR